MIWYWGKCLLCFILGHAGVVREWQFDGLETPLWHPRDEWTCVRCHRVVETRKPSTPRWAAPRPQVSDMMQDSLDEIAKAGGMIRVRVDGTKNLVNMGTDPTQDD